MVYASGINGWSSLEEGAPGEQWGPDMSALFDTVLKHVPPHEGDPDAPLQLQISALDYSTFVGRIGVGRINAGHDQAHAWTWWSWKARTARPSRAASTRC